MHIRTLFLATTLALVSVPIAQGRQHEGPQAAPASGQVNAQVTQCAQAQGLVTNALETALERLEEARLSNSPSALRAAADDVQTALLDVRARLEPCATMSAAVGPQGGHSMPNVPQAPSASPGTPVQPGSTVPAPGAIASRAPVPAGDDPHAGHVAPARPAAPAAAAPAPRQSPTRAPTAAGPARPESPATADPHGGHAASPASAAGPPAAPAPAATSRNAPAADPHAANGITTATPATASGELMCRNPVDPKTAPRMLYQGRTYYFCTEGDRAEFAKNPGKYVQAPAQKAPAHAH